MRILIAAPQLPYPWLGYTMRALDRLGHTTVPFLYTNRWVNRLNATAAARAYTQCWRHDRDDALIALARRIKPELTLILRGELIAVEALAELKRATAGPMVTWWVDDPDRYPGSQDRLQLYDHIFLFDRACARRLTEAGVGPVTFLPCACDDTVFHPRLLSRWQRARYGSQIALVAWFYPNRAPVVNALADFRLGIWGRGWRTPQARALLKRAVRRSVRGLGYVSDAQAAVIYNGTAIALNIHHAQSRDAALNTRTFEVLAAGAFQLMDAIPGMEELVRPGEEVVTYGSPEEARERATYFLRHPGQRAQIAARGQERVFAEHTYLHRMQTLLRVLAPDRARSQLLIEVVR